MHLLMLHMHILLELIDHFHWFNWIILNFCFVIAQFSNMRLYCLITIIKYCCICFDYIVFILFFLFHVQVIINLENHLIFFYCSWYSLLWLSFRSNKFCTGTMPFCCNTGGVYVFTVPFCRNSTTLELASNLHLINPNTCSITCLYVYVYCWLFKYG